MVIFGGKTDNQEFLNDVVLLDLENYNWFEISSLFFNNNYKGFIPKLRAFHPNQGFIMPQQMLKIIL